MITCLTRYHNTYMQERAYEWNDFDFTRLKRNTITNYTKNIMTFDIESSTITIDKEKDEYDAFMYHWQICIDGYVIFGRTWEQLQIFLKEYSSYMRLSVKNKQVVYVHNLSYEFQFMYNFFGISEVFTTDTHKVLKCIINKVFEFRCSYYLSNMNLLKFIENTPTANHFKMKDDLDYHKVVTPEDKLSMKEYGYCFNDVYGLYQAIENMLKEDTYNTIPLTSTGYVRRDCRIAMNKNEKNRKNFLKTQLDQELYQLCKDAFMGGNTASNRYYCNQIIEDMNSHDITSSYPFVMLSEKYPIGKFLYATIETYEELLEYNQEYCTIGRYVFTNIRTKKDTTIPSIMYSHCYAKENAIQYNGRILYADNIAIALTNIDFEILDRLYDYDEMYVYDFHFARKDYLPIELREKILYYYELKTKLKNVEGKEYEYMKAKNKLNAIYGMMVTDILHSQIEFNPFNGEYIEKEQTNILKYYKSRNSFLSYQWGVFITAYARKNLQRAIDIVGIDMVYCDTDSVKYIGDYTKEFQQLNDTIIQENIAKGVPFYIDHNGKRDYLGIFDFDGHYKYFKTMGAKKYCYIDNNDNLKITVAGLNKQKGAKELSSRYNGMVDFKEGTVFHDAGRTCAYYNNTNIREIVVNGCKIKTASNIAIVDVTYTLGITDTMKSILLTLSDNNV